MDKKKSVKSPVWWIMPAYFAQGLPFVTIATASVLMFKDFGISDTKIAFWTSTIMISYSLQPLWGAFIEMYKTKKFFVIFTQMSIGVLFGLVGFSLSLPNFFTYSIALLAIVAFAGATHDVAVNGVYLDELTPKAQAQWVGWLGVAYNIAKVLSGGALIYLAGELATRYGVVRAWTIVMWVYAAIMVALGLYHMKALPADLDKTVKSRKEVFDRLKDIVATFFQKKYIWFGLLFIVLYRFAEGQAIKIAPLFFKAAREEGGLGMSTSEIGIVYGTFGSLAFILGSIMGGMYVAKRGLSNKTLLVLCSFFNIPFVMFALLAYYMPDSLYIIGGAVALEYFGYGFGFVGLTLFMMQQIAPGKYKMTHYAFASSLMNLGAMVPSALSGYFSDMMGYQNFFIYVLVATIPSFLVCWLVPLKEVVEEEAS